MRIHAVLSGGKLASKEMYFHVYEKTDDGWQFMPGLLQSEDESLLRYVAEWGYSDKSDIVFELLDRRLEIGQEIQRIDTIESERHEYTYRIVELTDLLA
ncbi:hypothetical protein [Pseudomonas sp. W2I6]|uniref:hypothetical protein n=1 Tax=Pseudomonas sp. W2I6 TaxID=3042289 RepID=UPI0027891F32|nr:hypothetical protein [Pseudomonas sp. W2I6]MDQ0666707.1 hypothetical protein [Pseudomonas sp. W2I6]